MSHDARRRLNRRTQIETLEDRVVMSANPLAGFLGGAITQHAIDEGAPEVSGAYSVQQHAISEQPPVLGHHDLIERGISQQIDPNADFWLGDAERNVQESLGGEVEQNLSSAHDASGLSTVRENYGFRGGGQTVAVIDSGIAWDHYALGGGLGSSYRVVGGWDFTEGDADPYDDGTAGSHGTHVAGIVGASDGINRSGVAPDVDLVGLRVFDDVGNGYFSWVESALQWVHTNRNSFENPITAINLSLGTSWNSETTPNWAMLEDEFAQLEADGIFIAVSAGNSFTTYNEPGLSYPAASPYVVPVMSADDGGALSYFSQRLDRAIAAPGRYIESTVPDYAAGDADNITNDWGYKSGTSMAAPYVAGASVIIREAMEFVGQTNITQDSIYAHMRNTADTINDTATGLSYKRLNMEAAIDALMPTDDYGSSVEEAYNLGTITGGGLQANSAMEMSGVISTLDDADFFTFTAGMTGTVTFSAANITHNLATEWEGFGGEGWTNTGEDSYTMNVVSGQQYTVAINSDDGLGYYDLVVTADETFSYTDWGTTNGQATHTNLTFGDATWYRVTAGKAGFLSADTTVASGTVDIDLYDSNLQLIDDGGSINRVDHYAVLGEEFFIKVEGDGTGELRLTNLVTLSGSTVTVDGTTGDDTMTFTAGSQEHAVSVNGLIYTFDVSEYSTYSFDGAGGSDTATFTGTTGDEVATLQVGQASFAGQAFSASAANVETMQLNSGGGNDSVTFYDSASNDQLVATPYTTSLTGAGFSHTATGFASTTSISNAGGTDIALMYDSADNDQFTATPTINTLSGAGYSNSANGFTNVLAFATAGGNDTSEMYDSAGDDHFVGTEAYSTMTGTDYYRLASGFDAVTAHASGGNDLAQLFDSAGDDTLVATPNSSVLSGTGFSNTATGFDAAYSYATAGGNDTALYYDSTGDDHFISTRNYTYMTGAGFTNLGYGFDSNQAYSLAGGQDTAELYDSSADDHFVSTPDYSTLSGDGAYHLASGFDIVYGVSMFGGNDTAEMYDSQGNDLLVATPISARLSGTGFSNSANGFSSVSAYATAGGTDDALLYDSTGDDHLISTPDYSRLSGTGFSNYASGFDNALAFATAGGNDTAEIHDSSSNDHFVGTRDYSTITNANSYRLAYGFDEVFALSQSGGFDTADLYDSADDDEFSGSGSTATLSSDAHELVAEGFDEVTARSIYGGNDTSDVDAIDYAFNSIGAWS